MCFATSIFGYIRRIRGADNSRKSGVTPLKNKRQNLQ